MKSTKVGSGRSSKARTRSSQTTVEENQPGDIPCFPIRGRAADNVRQGKFSVADFSNILAELPAYLHPLVKFLHSTGMRSGQAKAISWDMIDDDNVLRMPGFLTKNGQLYSLALTNRKGEPYEATTFMVNTTRPHGELVFDTTNLGKNTEWPATN
jgi:hypothetical protein